jgi:mRNA interferase YafQ
MRTINRTIQFKKDYKRESRGRHASILDRELMAVLTLLVNDASLPPRLHDHALSGKWKSFRDLHIRPDLILIYRKPDEATLDLVRLGSHSELGL